MQQLHVEAHEGSSYSQTTRYPATSHEAANPKYWPKCGVLASAIC